MIPLGRFAELFDGLHESKQERLKQQACVSKHVLVKSMLFPSPVPPSIHDLGLFAVDGFQFDFTFRGLAIIALHKNGMHCPLRQNVK